MLYSVRDVCRLYLIFVKTALTVALFSGIAHTSDNISTCYEQLTKLDIMHAYSNKRKLVNLTKREKYLKQKYVSSPDGVCYRLKTTISLVYSDSSYNEGHEISSTSI